LEDWNKGSWGRDFSVLGLVAGGCGVNISVVDPPVIVYNTKNLLFKWGMGFTVDQAGNPLLTSLAPWPVGLFDHIPCIHGGCDCFSYNAVEVYFGKSGKLNPLLLRFWEGT